MMEKIVKVPTSVT